MTGRSAVAFRDFSRRIRWTRHGPCRSSGHAFGYGSRSLVRGMFAEAVVGFEMLDAFIRYASSSFWGSQDRGWRIRGASLGADAIAAVTEIEDLLVADDASP